MQKFAPPSLSLSHSSVCKRGGGDGCRMQWGQSAAEEQFSKASILAQKPTARTRESGRDRLERPRNELQRKNRQ